MRHSATRALLERDDVIIVASVSCIYGIGSVETYTAMTFMLKRGERINQRQLIADLVALQYKRTAAILRAAHSGCAATRIDIFPAHYEDRAWRVRLFGDEIERIDEFDPLTGQKTDELAFVKVYANSHYVTPRPTLLQAIAGIKFELRQRLEELNRAGRLLEAQRLEQRTLFDLEMMEATGSCAGIENYSRYLTGRKPGEPPPTLFEYVPDNALVFVDESHVTVPQLGGMYRGRLPPQGDARRVRLPPALLHGQPAAALRGMGPDAAAVGCGLGDAAAWELDQSGGVFVEQVIRPTGLIDPPVEVRPARTQVDDLVGEVRQVAAAGYRALVTVLTKRMAEDLTEYLHEQGLRVRYMHSDIDTIERIEIIRDLRLGAFDVLVGINLLREGLDIPECALVAILDADKEGFLRSETSLIQTIGRAARNVDGKVILYADAVTGSMERAMAETNRRREKQAGVQHGERHHARERAPGHRRHPRQRLRARPRAGRDRRRPRRRVRGCGHHRPQLRGGDQRPRDAHARGRRRPELRGSRPPARRDQAPARDRACRARRSDREAAGAALARAPDRANPASTRWARDRNRRGSRSAIEPRPSGHARRVQAEGAVGARTGLKSLLLSQLALFWNFAVLPPRSIGPSPCRAPCI